MGGMSKRVSPLDETTGKLSAAYYVYVSVEEEEQVQAAAGALEEALQRAVAESFPGEAGCAKVRSVVSQPPPRGSGHTGWVVGVTASIDLTAWRRDLGPTVGSVASETVRALLADADLTAVEARIDRVEQQLLVHAPQ